MSVPRRNRRRWASPALAIAAAIATAPAAHGACATRDVLVVGNNWDGTADIVDPARTSA